MNAMEESAIESSPPKMDDAHYDYFCKLLTNLLCDQAFIRVMMEPSIITFPNKKTFDAKYSNTMYLSKIDDRLLNHRDEVEVDEMYDKFLLAIETLGYHNEFEGKVESPAVAEIRESLSTARDKSNETKAELESREALLKTCDESLAKVSELEKEISKLLDKHTDAYVTYEESYAQLLKVNEALIAKEFPLPNLEKKQNLYQQLVTQLSKLLLQQEERQEEGSSTSLTLSSSLISLIEPLREFVSHHLKKPAIVESGASEVSTPLRKFTGTSDGRGTTTPATSKSTRKRKETPPVSDGRSRSNRPKEVAGGENDGGNVIEEHDVEEADAEAEEKKGDEEEAEEGGRGRKRRKTNKVVTREGLKGKQVTNEENQTEIEGDDEEKKQSAIQGAIRGFVKGTIDAYVTHVTGSVQKLCVRIQTAVGEDNAKVSTLNTVISTMRNRDPPYPFGPKPVQIIFNYLKENFEQLFEGVKHKEIEDLRKRKEEF